MKMQMKTWIPGAGVLLISALLIAACGKDDEANKATFQLELTDAPVDDPQVEAVVFTVSDVKLDGKSVAGFQGKQTLDLKAYTAGKTKLLFNGQVEAGAYEQLTLVLDGASEADGSSPGTYILLQSGEKIALTTSSLELDIATPFEIAGETNNRFVLDVNLRKAIRHSSSQGGTYDWATETEIEAGLRLVNYIQSGTILGSCTDQLTQSEKIVAYAYVQGSFDMNTEMTGPHGNNFPSAVNSVAVDASGQYQLSFLPEDTYEIHFAGYRDLDADGRLELIGMLSVNSLLGPATDNIEITNQSSLEINVEVTGLLPL